MIRCNSFLLVGLERHIFSEGLRPAVAKPCLVFFNGVSVMRRPYVTHALPACDAGHGSPAADSGRSAAEWTRNLFHEQYLFQPLKALNRFNEKFFTVMLVLRTP